MHASQHAPRTYSRISQALEPPPAFSQDGSKTLPRQPKDVDVTTSPLRGVSRIRLRKSPNPDFQTPRSWDESSISPRTAKARNEVHVSALASSVGIPKRSSKERVGTMVQSSQPKRIPLEPILRYAEMETLYRRHCQSYTTLLGYSILLLEKMESLQIAPLLAKFNEVFIAASGVEALKRMLSRVKRLSRKPTPTPRYAAIEKMCHDYSADYGRVLKYYIVNIEKVPSGSLAPLLAKLKEAHRAHFRKSALTGMDARNGDSIVKKSSSGAEAERAADVKRLLSAYHEDYYHVLVNIVLDLEEMTSPQIAPLLTIAMEAYSFAFGSLHLPPMRNLRSTKDEGVEVDIPVKNSMARAEELRKVESTAEHQPSIFRKAYGPIVTRDVDVPETTEGTTSRDARAKQKEKQYGSVKADMDKQQVRTDNPKVQSPKRDKKKSSKTNLLEVDMALQPKSATEYNQMAEKRYETQRASRNMHNQSKAINSSKHPDTAEPSKQTPSPGKNNEVASLSKHPSTIKPSKQTLSPGENDEVASLSKPLSEADMKTENEQSLLEELFPEASSYIQPYVSERSPYPKLDLPSGVRPLVVRQEVDVKKSLRERLIEGFQKSGERITALQFLNCSTEFTESDFRRLVPKGRHIESWATKGEFYKIIPGRDPLSLERLPFYYLLFKSTESALAYQANVARLHKLCSLRQASNIMSVMPVPQGLLEDGEDISAAMSSYLLKPPSLRLNLNTVMQPYNPALRTLLENGGYRPIMPSVAPNGKPLYKVLFQINGWEPTAEDLHTILCRHARQRGISWPLHTESPLAIRKLRDIIDLKARLQPLSSPRAADSFPAQDKNAELDPTAGFQLPELGMEGNIHQMVMARVYNRWIVEFDEEDGARRFSRLWNRRVLPQPRFVTWRDTEEERMVTAEYLW